MRTILIITIACAALVTTAGSAFAGEKRADTHYRGHVLRPDRHARSSRVGRRARDGAGRQSARDRPVQRASSRLVLLADAGRPLTHCVPGGPPSAADQPGRIASRTDHRPPRTMAADQRESGGTGRRAGLRIRCPKGRGSSNLPSRTPGVRACALASTDGSRARTVSPSSRERTRSGSVQRQSSSVRGPMPRRARS